MARQLLHETHDVEDRADPVPVHHSAVDKAERRMTLLN
jgi:hypothetical protein